MNMYNFLGMDDATDPTKVNGPFSQFNQQPSQPQLTGPLANAPQLQPPQMNMPEPSALGSMQPVTQMMQAPGNFANDMRSGAQNMVKQGLQTAGEAMGIPPQVANLLASKLGKRSGAGMPQSMALPQMPSFSPQMANGSTQAQQIFRGLLG